jgi:uncharacterized protein YciI
MYVIAILRYRRSLEEILTRLDAHRSYLRSLRERGILLASGPFDPRAGGALLLRVPDGSTTADLDAIRDADPFVRDAMAQYEILPWNPVIGGEDLDRLGRADHDSRR